MDKGFETLIRIRSYQFNKKKLNHELYFGPNVVNIKKKNILSPNYNKKRKKGAPPQKKEGSYNKRLMINIFLIN